MARLCRLCELIVQKTPADLIHPPTYQSSTIGRRVCLARANTCTCSEGNNHAPNHHGFDLETRLDISAVARAYQLEEGDHAWARSVIGDRFPPPIFHEIICIGVLRAVQNDGAWKVEALGAPHIGGRNEKNLLADL